MSYADYSWFLFEMDYARELIKLGLKPMFETLPDDPEVLWCSVNVDYDYKHRQQLEDNCITWLN